MRDTLPLLVFISLERKDDPCQTGEKAGFRFYPCWKYEWHFTLLVFISLERKNDTCKTGEKAGHQFYPYWKYDWHFNPFSVYFIREEGRPLWNGGRKQVFDFTLVENMIGTLLLLVFISLERKDDHCKTVGESRFSISPLLKICVTLHPFSVNSIREEERPL